MNQYSRRARRSQFRLGLSVLTLTGLCLGPAISLADGPVDPIVVTTKCEITGKLEQDAPKSTLPDGTEGGPVEKGTPSGTLEDGSICVLPPDPKPEPKPEPDPQPAEQPPADPAPAPAADTPAQPAAPAEEPAPQAEVQPEPETAVAPATAPAPAAEPPAPAAAAAAKPDSDNGSERRPARTRRHVRVDTNLRGHVLKRKQPRRDKPVESVLAGPDEPTFYVSDEAEIPRFLLKLYKEAGRHHHIPWPILAAINEIETDFGRNVAVSSAGAVGWMQFMPATWRVYGVDADHNGSRDPLNPRDAIFAAARYLRASGARSNLRRAIFAYNHAGWYVDSVILRANRIAAQQGVRSKRLSRLLKARTRRLEREVLADPRITIYDCGRQDIAEHRIDRRVLVALRFLAWSGLNPTVTSLECGHSYLTKSGHVSEHSSGNAVDISAINGVPILGNQGPGSVAEATIRELLTLRGAGRPHQIISLMTFEDTDNTFAMGDHADHLHVGFAPLKPIDPHGLVEDDVPTDSIVPPAPAAPLGPLATLAPVLFPWSISG